MHERSIAARMCLVAALCTAIGVPGLHAVLHEIEEHAHQHQRAEVDDHDHDHDDHDHDHDDHGHDHHEDGGDEHHHHHRHGRGDGPLHGKDAPEHLQLALTEAPPPPVAPIPELADDDEPIGLADRLLAHQAASTRSSRGPPLKRV